MEIVGKKGRFAKLAFIGGGNLTRSLVSGLLDIGYPKDAMFIADRNEDKCKSFGTDFGVYASRNVQEVIKSGDFLILSIKPQGFKEFSNQYANDVKKVQPLVISVMAGVNLSTLEHSFESKCALVRAMPNTASMVKAGATGLYANSAVSSQQKDAVEAIFRNLGTVCWVKQEKLINAVIAVAGSAPAYFLYLIEQMQAVGVKMGLSEEDAHVLALQSAYGAAKMGLQSDVGLAKLREAITSKGGTTAAAIEAFEKGGFADIVEQAMGAAFDRGESLEQLHYDLLQNKSNKNKSNKN